MKINIVIDSMSRAAGGLFDAERRLCQSLSRTGVTFSAFSLADEFSARDANDWLPVVPEIFPPNWPGVLGRSAQLRSRLLSEPADLLYRAGLWKWPSHYALEWCRLHKKPEIIAPHGMLDPWAVKNSAWKKRLALMLYEREHLDRAACIRVLCEAEAEAVRAFGLKNPICIIPNGIDVPDVSSQKSVVSSQTPDLWPLASGRKVLLYLGRIHPKKGLVNLLKAWKQTLNSQPSTNDWLLAIAGWDQGGHEKELRMLTAECGIQNSVMFLGPKFGEDKAACYRKCDAFILPSFSEGLPMVVLEAWAYGKPVLMTPECNLPEGFAAGAALRMEPSAEGIARGLQELFRTPHSALRTLGDNGRALVAGKFTWPKVAADMKSVYDWTLGGGPRPECVQTKS
jgi:poly(glycerol-phosphate) alpha-glucosyltransferase